LFERDASLEFTFTGYRCFGETEDVVVFDRWDESTPAIVDRLLTSVTVNTSTVVATRSCLVGTGLFDETLRCCQDHDMWLRVATQGYHMGYVAKPLTRYRVHDTNISSDRALVAASQQKVFAKFFSESQLPGDLDRRRRRYRARWDLNVACGYLAAGNGAAARKALISAARHRPASIRAGWLRLYAETWMTPHLDARAES
jgi:hypothetical protein